FCLALFSLPVPRAAGAPETVWWNRQWKCRRIIEVREPPAQNYPVAVFSFANGGYLAKGSGDLVVIDRRGQKVPFRIIWNEPKGTTILIFPAKRKGERFFLYYNNPAISRTDSLSWQPQVSLTLETREDPGGKADSWTDMKRLLGKSRKVYGKGFVNKIWQGLNPYGPNDNYLSIYQGFLNIKEGGTYRIATVSDEASFLFIDGKRVAEWPGRHKIWGGMRGEHSGTVELRPGLHSIAYYHREEKGAQFMIAAWKRPGEDKLEIIPTSAYLHPARAGEISYQKLSRSLVAYFRVAQDNEIIKDGLQYTKVSFRDRSYGLKDRKGSYLWDFGDGTTSRARFPSHIYIGIKNYPVTLTVTAGKERDSFQFLVRIKESLDNLTVESKDSLSSYAQIINTYPLGELDKESLLSYINLLESSADKRYLIPLCESYLKKYGRYDRKLANRITWLLAESYELSDPRKAIAVYAGIVKKGGKSNLILKAKWARADLYLYKTKDYDEALKIYKSILSSSSSRQDKARLARVRVGDVYRKKGEYRKAKEIYAQVEKRTIRDMGVKEALIKQGTYFQMIETYLKEDRLEVALKKLKEWEMNFPLAKLSGELPLLYSKYFSRKGDYVRALDELKGLMELNPHTTLRPEAELLMAQVYFHLGKKGEAKELYRKIRKEYPGTPVSRSARKAYLRQF
ncbi:MAG: tetratricopeptide repeat protein, partial [Nitrospirae bacterium]|nr:tetratricopeptide repeat protein [Nitrospirota bacterium]